MKKILFIFFALFVSSTISTTALGQTYQTSTTTCGNCQREVRNAKVGNYCPYCKVKWGWENTETTKHNNYRTPEDIYPTLVTTSATSTVKQFLNCLGNKEFYKAYSLTDNTTWKNKGGASWFSSFDAYGGIDYVSINNISVKEISDDRAYVYVSYFARDLLHTSRNWNQTFVLANNYGEWKIIKILN